MIHCYYYKFQFFEILSLAIILFEYFNFFINLTCQIKCYSFKVNHLLILNSKFSIIHLHFQHILSKMAGMVLYSYTSNTNHGFKNYHPNKYYSTNRHPANMKKC